VAGSDLHRGAPAVPADDPRPNDGAAKDPVVDPSAWTRSAAELDDVRDRPELRGRYDMLLQELRVLLPGVQILVAFLLTAPFAERFELVDELGRVLYGVALTFGLLSILAFTTPIALHRFGDRAARSSRLVLSIRAARVGIACLGVSLLAAFAVIVRLVYDAPAWWLLVGVVALAMASSWIALPQLVREHRGSTPDQAGSAFGRQEGRG
jgi:hypothetical protein